MRIIFRKTVIFLTAAFGLLVLLYLFICFALPFILNKHDYSGFISETVKKETGLELVIKNYRLKISPSLALTMKAENLAIFYPNRQQILDIENIKTDISLLSLLKKEIKITKIKADKLQFSNKLKTSGKFSIQEYFEDMHTPAVLSYSQKFPTVNIAEYTVKIKDEKTGLHYKITGRDYKMTQDIMKKNILLNTKGEIYTKGKKNIDYKLKLSIPKDIFLSTEKNGIDLSDMSKYSFKASADADLKIYSKNGKYNYTSGKIKITDFSILINGAYTPKSSADITLNQSLAYLDAKIYTAKNENADINAKIKLTNPQNIELHCKTDRINIANLKTLLVPVLDIMKVKNNLSDFKAGGFISANFNLKTDMKKVKSNGKLSIKQGSLKHKQIPLNINGINAEIDFSNNSIKIIKSNLLVNNQPVTADGTINTKAEGNIKVSAKNLDLNHILNAFPELKPDKNILITSGKLYFDVFLNGKLSNPQPRIKADISDFSAQLKDITFSTDSISLNTDVKKQTYNGNLKINKLSAKNGLTSLHSDLISAVFDEDRLKIADTTVYAGTAPLNVSGEIKNYKISPVLNFQARGTVDPKLLKSLINRKEFIKTGGAIPVSISLKSKNNTSFISVKALSDKKNYIKPEAFSLKNTSRCITSLDAEIENKKIFLRNLSLYSAGGNADIDTNIAKLPEILNINGIIENNEFKNLRVLISPKTELQFESLPASSIKTDGLLVLNGNTEKPEISGTINFYDLNIPDYNIKLSTGNADFNEETFSTTINGLNIKNMTFDTKISADSDFLNTKKIKNLKIYANLLDMDELAALSNIMPRNNYTPGFECGFDIQTGEITFNTFKMNKILASNIHSNITVENNVLKLHDLSADAYGGKIAAKIDYNLPYATVNAKFQGRNLNAQTAGKSLFPVDPQTTGIMSFDADIQTFGFTPEQHKKNLKGSADILVKNAKLGPLGRFEHFLYAQNLLSQRLIYISLNSAKQAIVPRDTGRVNYMKASVNFNNGFIYINPALTSGPQMSMYVKGIINMMTNTANLEILGKISPEVSSSLGLFGQRTIKDFLDEHTNSGKKAEKMLAFFNKELPEADISKIPPLTPRLNRETKNFKVLIDGDINSVKSVKSFTWVNGITRKNSTLNTEIKNSEVQINTKPQPQQEKEALQVKPQKTIEPAGFLDNIPDTFAPTKPKIQVGQ